MIDTIIVEDDPMITAINKKYLEKNKNIKVIKTFSNGADALQYLRCHHANLVLLDVYMPHLNGIEVLRSIREERIHVDVIMITAANDSKSIDIALKLGIIDYLIKPFEFERFQEALHKYFTKISVMSSKSDSKISQSELDQILNTLSTQQHIDLEKGIQQKTLKFIQDYMGNHRGVYYSNDQLAQQIGLSRVTVHRYLNYLERQKIVNSSVDYETKGRPGIKYMMP